MTIVFGDQLEVGHHCCLNIQLQCNSIFGVCVFFFVLDYPATQKSGSGIGVAKNP